jgi:hypothetical protein
LASGGYIIKINPRAMGRLVVPTWKRLMKDSTPGMTYPAATPTAIAKKIHRVRNRSRNDNCLRKDGKTGEKVTSHREMPSSYFLFPTLRKKRNVSEAGTLRLSNSLCPSFAWHAICKNNTELSLMPRLLDIVFVYAFLLSCRRDEQTYTQVTGSAGLATHGFSIGGSRQRDLQYHQWTAR